MTHPHAPTPTIDELDATVNRFRQASIEYQAALTALARSVSAIAATAAAELPHAAATLEEAQVQLAQGAAAIGQAVPKLEVGMLEAADRARTGLVALDHNTTRTEGRLPS